MTTTSERLIVALDGLSRHEALELAELLSGYVWGFKVNDLLVEYGVQIVKDLKAQGNVFADPKLHDIPNTVANGVRRLVEAGAQIITVHASGAETMIRAAVTQAKSCKIVAVTALTSLSHEECEKTYGKSPANLVKHFATLALNAGAHGIVCSPLELELFPKTENFIRIVPGIRPEWVETTKAAATADDQSRIATPKAALDRGATYLVVGRPITHSNDPVESTKRILGELRG
ncbi:orotidine-5'-phosphate decarboxylase [bacterium]|nr:orotidine-5'-phosphate decarboxylase [bacterium]